METGIIALIIGSATALCGLCIPLGNLVAFIMSGLIFSGVPNDDYAAIKAAVVKMIWI